MKELIKFIEENVDGCGTNAEVMYAVECGHGDFLTNGHRYRLEKELEEIKKQADSEDWDTDTMVEEAMKRVFGEAGDMEVVSYMEIIF